MPEYRGHPLPPLLQEQIKALSLILSFVPPHLLDDAIQEVHLLAWQGLDPVVGLAQWRKRELGRNPGVTEQDQERPRRGAVQPVTERLHQVSELGIRREF